MTWPFGTLQRREHRALPVRLLSASAFVRRHRPKRHTNKSHERENAPFAVKLETELRKGQPTSAEVQAARNEVESLLCPIISRTERASHDDGWDHFETQPGQSIRGT
jgi:hypothetical protein